MADCVCAIENMMIAANDFGLGSCYINQLHWLTDNTRIIKYMMNLGLQINETICASMVVGYPDTKDGLPNRKERIITGNSVDYIV